MKKMRKGLVVVLMTVLAVLCFAIAACAGGITFKFETNGGNTIESVKVAKGEEFTLPDPEREGYSFEGWFENEDLSGNPVAKQQTAEQNRTFYAKWEKMYLVTLDVVGGSVSSTSFYLKKGEKLLTALKDYVPIKENFRFGEWLYGDKALTAADTMPEQDITLTAHYMVGYTVERYLQSLDNLAIYEKEQENYVGYAYAGSSAFKLDPEEVAPKGFNAIEHEGEITQKVLSETPSENLFKMYFDRAEIHVTLYSNYPDADIEQVDISGLYGEKVLLPEDGFYASGYCLTGWSKSVTGEDAIPSNYLNTFLFGGTDEELYYYELEEDLLLYGIWTKGYIDNFESIDYIYHFSADAEEVYLERAGIFFKGEYDARTNGFFFYDEGGEKILEGIFNDQNGTFAYYVTFRQRNLSLYVMGTGLDPNTVLILDELNNVTYTQSVDNEQGGKTVIAQSEGTYSYLEGVEYEATFTSGELAGTSFVFIQGYTTVNNVETPVFSIRDEKSYSLGIVAYVAMYQGSPLVYPQNLNAIMFDGYGVAALNLGTSIANYYYRFAEQEDTFYLYDTSTGRLLETCKILNVSGQRAYCTYDASFDNTFTSGTETLTLDGLYNATYSGDSTITGCYTATASAFGGYIVTVYTSSEPLIFHVYATQEMVDNQIVIAYHFDKKALGYSEYYYKDDQAGVYYHYAPLIVLNESKAGEFSLYAIDTASITTRIFVKVAAGTYVEKNGKRHATITEYFKEPSAYRETPIDIANLAEIVFDTAYISTSNYGISPIAYWYSVKYQEESESKTFDIVYNEEESESSLHAKLSLIAGFAVLTFEEDGEEWEIIGSYTRADNILVIVTSSGNLALEMNDDDKTFIILNSLLGTVYAMGEDGVATRNEFIDFDGKNGAVYSIVTPAETEGEDAKVTSYTGTFEATGNQTALGGTIYHFKGELDGVEMEFDFLLIRISDTTLFTKHNEEYEGVYTDTGESGATLTLDGFGFNARITIGKNQLDGYYYVHNKEENVICFVSSSVMFYFDIAGRTFTQRGNEYASYLLMRNQGIGNEVLDLDGHGHFTIYTLEEDERKEVHSGAYTYEMYGDTPLFTLVYNEGAEEHTIRGILSSITLGSDSVSYNTFVVYNEEIVTLLVNEEELSVILLDGFGNAIRYNALGIPELGQYVIISKNLLYYANREGSDACIYTYDLEKGTAIPSDFTPRSYFTEDLEALVFYSYGFMIYGGETQYYYNIKDGQVYLYHRDESSSAANEYGFVEEEFGTFGTSIEWNEKTYYITNGYQLMFTRDTENEESYPVTLNDGSKAKLENLTFTPTGAAEFRVRGSVVVGGRSYSCYVERTLDDEEHPTMTLILGSYRFALEVTYSGEDASGNSYNTYTLSSMRLEQQLPSTLFLASVYIYAMQGLTQPQNVFGLITILDTYDEKGEVVSQQATGEFGEYSGLIDSKGKAISFEKVNYTLESGLYTVEVTGSDDVTYRLHFTVDGTFASIFGLYGYSTFAFTRVENLEADGGYKMEIERVIATDSERVRVGGVYDVVLKLNDDVIEATEAYFDSEDLVITHIVRTFEDGVRIGATYYVIQLTEQTTEGAEEVLEVPFLKEATVTKKNVTTVNGSEANTYADYTEENGAKKVELVVFNGAAYFADTTEEKDGLLHVTTKSGRHFTVDVEHHSIALVTE